MGPGYFWWGGMWIFPIIMITVMIIVLYLIFGRGGFRLPWQDHENYSGRKEDSETALDILKKRYAKGEITKEEFEEMKRTIQIKEV
ncbi:MAG: SHOCT domain-containing protein [Thermodesulfobacteriota bacterium]|nr:MAG: SHOCT domain-containing protein [Thermodesulfobacteriota bacterium]